MWLSNLTALDMTLLGCLGRKTSTQTNKLKESKCFPFKVDSFRSGEGMGVWFGEAKVSRILRHRGVQLILTYNWTRSAILAAGWGRGGMFYSFCFFTFLHFPPSPLSLSFISSTVSSISSSFLRETTPNDPQGLKCH